MRLITDRTELYERLTMCMWRILWRYT